MRDLSLLLILLALAWLALLRPWLGVLGLAVLSYMHPQGYAQGFMKAFPSYLALFAVVCLSLAYHSLREGTWRTLPWQRFLDWRLLILATLWLWFAVSSRFSVAPWEAWDKYRDVLKILPPLVLTVLLIDNREKLHYLIVTIALSIALIALKGGYWAVMTGFQDRVYGPPASAYSGNNEFAVAAAMAIPLLVLWLHETRQPLLRLSLMGAIALSYGAALSSWSRGGMLALGAMTLLLILHSRRKWLSIPLLIALGAMLFTQLPDKWFGRMQTFTAIEADPSAQSRLAVWRIGLDFAGQHPLTGGGFNAWPALTLSTGGSLDWHSAYIEMVAEHGFVGLAIWAVLLFGTLFGLLARAWRRRDALSWQADYGAMLAVSLAAYLVGGLTLGIAYWELPYHLVVLAVLLKRVVPESDIRRA